MKSPKGALLTALAVVTCPCHLPLVLVVAAGTSAGAWLARYQGPLFIVMAATFAASLFWLLQQVGEKGARR